MSYRHQARGRPRTDRHRGNARPEARDSQPGRHVPLLSKAIEFHRTVTRWLSREGAGRSPAMKFLTTAAIALVAATTAQAAEIKQIGGDISITGMITPGDAAKFKAIAANIGGTVILNSPGGYVAEAALISIQIRSQSYATRVPRRAKCNSACALIWLAGIRRELDPRSLVGVHRVRQFGHSELTDEEANTLAAWAMRESGAPEALVNLALSTNSKSMSYVNYEKAKAWGLLDPPPTPKGIPPAAAKSDLSSATRCCPGF